MDEIGFSYTVNRQDPEKREATLYYRGREYSFPLEMINMLATYFVVAPPPVRDWILDWADRLQNSD